MRLNISVLNEVRSCFMGQVRLSFEGTSAIELAEILQVLPGYVVTVEVLDDGTVKGIGQKEIRKVIVTLTLAATMLNTGAEAVKTGAEAVKTGAEAGSAVMEFLQNMKELQAGPGAIEQIVVIPEEGDRQLLTRPSGEELVEAIEGSF